jgi:hypothetical protein
VTKKKTSKHTWILNQFIAANFLIQLPISQLTKALQGLFGNFLLNHAGGFHLLSQAVGVRSGQLVTEIVSNAEARATDPSVSN